MRHRFLMLLALTWLAAIATARTKEVWVIDAGHGGKDTGCEGKSTNEKAITLAIAKEVGRLVKKHISGVRVVYTREKDKTLTLQERCDIANARGAALFLSIHVNAAPSLIATGTESYYSTNVPLNGNNAGKSELLCLLLQRQYLSHGRAISRGVKQNNWYVLEHTVMPGVLTEVGFISNIDEEAYMSSKGGQAELATAIYEALAEWHKMTDNGPVDRRNLLNLRYAYYDPKESLAPTLPPATPAEAEEEAIETKKDEQARAEAAARAAAKEQAAAKAKAQEQASTEVATLAQSAENADKAQPTEQSVKASPKNSSTTPQSPANATPSRPIFAIQLMNTATVLKPGDYRLKGYTDVRHIPAGERFKVIYGKSDNYKDIRNQLSLVRETFPEAFIVAFLGDQQISTAEALKMLAQ